MILQNMIRIRLSEKERKRLEEKKREGKSRRDWNSLESIENQCSMCIFFLHSRCCCSNCKCLTNLRWLFLHVFISPFTALNKTKWNKKSLLCDGNMCTAYSIETGDFIRWHFHIEKSLGEKKGKKANWTNENKNKKTKDTSPFYGCSSTAMQLLMWNWFFLCLLYLLLFLCSSEYTIWSAPAHVVVMVKTLSIKRKIL